MNWVLDAVEAQPGADENSPLASLPAIFTLQNEHVRIQV
jgi:hypothetical protein